MKHLKIFEDFNRLIDESDTKVFWKAIKTNYWNGNKIDRIDANELTLMFDDAKSELSKFIKFFNLKPAEGFNGEKLQSKIFDDNNEITVRIDGDALIITAIGDHSKKEVEVFIEKYMKMFSLTEGAISDKDWDRMLDLVLSGKDGSSVASSIKDKNKAIARFITGIKLSGENIKFSEVLKRYSGSFSEFGDKALQLGATKEEIQKSFDETPIPDKYSSKLNNLGSKDKKLKDRFVGPLSKLILDLGLDIKFLSTNGNAITREGRDAMQRNGRKWTIGYKAQITLGDKNVMLVFDAITDEGDGPTFFVIDKSTSDILKNEWSTMGQRQFLSKVKEELDRVK